MIGIRETYEIEPPTSSFHMLRWDVIFTRISQPLQLVPESPASDESFTLAHIPSTLFDESPSSSDPTDLNPHRGWTPTSWIKYGTNDDMDFVIHEEARRITRGGKEKYSSPAPKH